MAAAELTRQKMNGKKNKMLSKISLAILVLSLLSQCSCILKNPFLRPPKAEAIDAESARPDSPKSAHKAACGPRLNFSGYNYVKISNKKIPPTTETMHDTIPFPIVLKIFRCDSTLKPFFNLNRLSENVTVVIENLDHIAFKSAADSSYFVTYFSYEPIALNQLREHAIDLPDSGYAFGQLQSQNSVDWWKIPVYPESDLLIKIEASNPNFNLGSVLFDRIEGDAKVTPITFSTQRGLLQFHIKSKTENLYLKLINPFAELLNYSMEKRTIFKGHMVENLDLNVSKKFIPVFPEKFHLSGRETKLLKFYTFIAGSLEVREKQPLENVSLTLLNALDYSEVGTKLNPWEASFDSIKEDSLKPGKYYLKVQSNSDRELTANDLIDIEYRFDPTLPIEEMKPVYYEKKLTVLEQIHNELGEFLLDNAFKYLKEPSSINLLGEAKARLNKKGLNHEKVFESILKCYEERNPDSTKAWRALYENYKNDRFSRNRSDKQ